MSTLDITTMKAIFAMQDLRDLCEQGKEFVDKFCSVSYVEILLEQGANASKEKIKHYTERLTKAICLLGDYISGKSFSVKSYDLITIERLHRIADFIKEQNDPTYIKLHQRVQHLITKYNRFRNYTTDREQLYGNLNYEDERVRIYDLFLTFSQGTLDLCELSISDVQAIKHIHTEEKELMLKVKEKYEDALKGTSE